VQVAHALEDGFVAAQAGRIVLGRGQVDALLAGVDLLTAAANVRESEASAWTSGRNAAVDAFLKQLADALRRDGSSDPSPRSGAPSVRREGPADPSKAPVPSSRANGPSTPSPRSDEDLPHQDAPAGESNERVLRLTAENLNRLLGLASEALVDSRRLKPMLDSLSQLARLQENVVLTLDRLYGALDREAGAESAIRNELVVARDGLREWQRLFADRATELDRFDQRLGNVAQRMYDEAVGCRMRPFSDATSAWPRVVRDLAHSLGKQARLVLEGLATQVDRDILAQLDAPLGHLLRNAVDHGLESPDERLALGKPEVGVVTLTARHSGGALFITVADDGRGVDLDELRRTIVERKMTTTEAAAVMSDAELLEFLFLPGFSMKGTVTETSGRGVGLDAVRDMLKQVHGVVHVSSQHGQGTRFQLQLPVTLSVVRTLIVEVADEPYAFPLAQLAGAVKVARSQVQVIEGRPYFIWNDRLIGLVSARQVLGQPQQDVNMPDIPVVVIGDTAHTYAVAVDGFLLERELVVQPLDRQLGKVENIAAGGLMEDGSPVLIVDTADLIRSIEKAVSHAKPAVAHKVDASKAKPRKRVLVVDDSLTVREVERKLIGNRGYDVEVAVDGMDGWNAVRSGAFDLVVTDIDMPRMDGIELVTLITKDPRLQGTPVMVVSYKDRDEDRRRGLEAGAAYYLTKSSFNDDTLVQAVVDLIGEPAA
jgi:two-component system sensor histidine kinase and response regulator WspE